MYNYCAICKTGYKHIPAVQTRTSPNLSECLLACPSSHYASSLSKEILVYENNIQVKINFSGEECLPCTAPCSSCLGKATFCLTCESGYNLAD